MKNVSISLTDQHAAEIHAEIATGDYASVSEVIRSALREFLNRPIGPTFAQMERDIAEYRAAEARGDKFFTADEVLAQLRADADADGE